MRAICAVRMENGTAELFEFPTKQAAIDFGKETINLPGVVSYATAPATSNKGKLGVKRKQ